MPISPTDVVLAITYFLILYLTMFWLLVFFDRDDVKKKKLKNHPLVSILIPAYNEEHTISHSLSSALDLDYPNVEIIVVNDGSTDKTKQVVKKIQAKFPKRIKLINQINKGKGAALNHALKYAKGVYYATLDADSSVDKTILSRLIPYFTNDNVACVLPLLKIRNPENILQRIQRYEYIINMFYKKLNSMLDCVHVTPGPFSVYRKDVVTKLGGYDEHNITEDLEIAIRLQKYQYKIVQTAEPAVYTIPPDTIHGLYRQRNRWYKGSVLNSIKYKGIMFNKKYGDFGYVRLPTIILSGLLSVIVLGTISYELVYRLVTRALELRHIDFDLITLFRNWTFDYHILDMSFLKVSIAVFVVLLGIVVMIASFRHSREKIRTYGKTFFTLAYYMFLYSILLSIVWLMIGIEIVRGKVQKW